MVLQQNNGQQHQAPRLHHTYFSEQLLPKIYHIPKIFINADVNEREVNGATCLSIQSQDINIIVNQLLYELQPVIPPEPLPFQ